MAIRYTPRQEIIIGETGLSLRQVEHIGDDVAMRALVMRSQEHLSQHGSPKHPQVSHILRSLHETTAQRLYGRGWATSLCLWYHAPDDINAGPILLGNIDAHPKEDGDIEIGYWLGEEFCGNGYASLAVNALCTIIDQSRRFGLIRAEVMIGNEASAAVLQRNEFVEHSRTDETIVFVRQSTGPVKS